MLSAEMAATAMGRKSGSSTLSAASATKTPLSVIDEKKSGPPRRAPEPDRRTAIGTRTGTPASTSMPARLRRRPNTSTSSERRNRPPNRNGARPAGGASAASAADIEALPGERDEDVLEVGSDHA